MLRTHRAARTLPPAPFLIGLGLLACPAPAATPLEVPFGRAGEIALQAEPGKPLLKLNAWFKAPERLFERRWLQVLVNGTLLRKERLKSPARFLQPRSRPYRVERFDEKLGAFAFPITHRSGGLGDWSFDDIKEYSIWVRAYREFDQTVYLDLAGIAPDAEGRFVVTLPHNLGASEGRRGGPPEGPPLVVDACELAARVEPAPAEAYFPPTWHALRDDAEALIEAERRYKDPETAPEARGSLAWALGRVFEAAGEEDRAVECFKHGVGLEAAFPEKEELRYRLLARGLAGPSPEADDKWGFARLGHLVAKGRRGEADPGIIPLKRWNGTYSVDGRDREDLWRDEAFPWRELAHRVNGESPSKTPNEVKVAYDAGGVILFARGPALEWLMPGDLAGENRPVWQYNCFELFVTPNLKLTDYFELNLSASGGRYDGHQEWYFMGHEEWDGKWKSAVHSDGKTLFVEYYVPWADLELEAPPAPGTLWIANVIRVQFLPGADGKLVQGEFSWGPLKQRAFHRLQDGVVWKFE